MLIISEHNGHKLEHDEDKHHYTLDGKPLPGVTTLLGRGYPKSRFLIDWQVKEGAKWVIDQVSTIKDIELELDNIIKESPNAYKVALHAAGDIGSVVHDFAYHTEANKPFKLKEHLEQENQSFRKAVFMACRQFKEWKASNNDEIITLEALVCSTSLSFAGRFDRLAKRNGVVTLTDYKTASGFFITQFIQMAAYCIAIEEWMDIKVQDVEIVRFDKKTGKLTSRNLEQLAKTVGLTPKSTLKRLKEQFNIILSTVQFQEKFDRYIKK